MPEVSGFDSLSELSRATRKSSNMSTSSDDSLRKISNDSGISISSSQTMPSSISGGRTQFDHLLNEPRLSNDFSTAVLLAQQQSISAAAALNPAMFGLMSAGLGGLWSNPLAAAMLQQEAQATTRKMIESAGAKTSAVNSGKQYPKEPFPMHPGFSGLMQSNCSNQMAEQLALTEALRSQLLSRKLSEDPVKPTRKANSFSGSCSSPLVNRRPSPPINNTVSPNVHGLHLSPGINNVHTHSGDEQQQSPYGDEDTSSNKSSVRSRTPPPQHSQSHINQSSGYSDNTALPNHQHLQPAGRKRKNGIIAGSQPMAPDLSSYSVSNHPAFPLHPVDSIPMHKLSTASLPANFPSNASIVQDQLLNLGCSPAATRKRQRNGIGMERNGIGMERNGIGMERNGIGMERNGIGMERNGIGMERMERNVQPDDKNGAPREDESYWERRRKNNEAAKRSRDSRRAKEDEIAIRAAFLEQENLRLRVDLNKMKEEFSQLKTELDECKKSGEKSAGEGSEEITPASGASKSPAADMETASGSPTQPTVTNGYTS